MAPEINVEADFEGNSRIEDGKSFVCMNILKSFLVLIIFKQKFPNLQILNVAFLDF